MHMYLLRPAPGTDSDVFEHAGEVICNVSQLKEARTILLEVERGILPALVVQLSSTSVTRRRGTMGAIRCGAVLFGGLHVCTDFLALAPFVYKTCACTDCVPCVIDVLLSHVLCVLLLLTPWVQELLL